MINANKFILELKKLNIDFFTGVPDSLMSSFSKSLHFDFNDDNHIISTNEGSAIAAGMGYHLATNKVPLIYMSAYIYGKQELLPIKENSIINPSNPYAQSKLLCEKICKYYADVFTLDITILRPFNVYGPDQEKHFLIPEIVEQIKKSKKIIVNSFQPKRDFVYIEDLVNALTISSKKLKGLQIYNIGSGVSVSVKEIIELLDDLVEEPLEYEERGLERKGEMMDVVADISAANKSLSWNPEISLKEGLKQILLKEGLCS